MSIQISRLITKYPNLFEDNVSYEGEDGIWISPRMGYMNPYTNTHCIHEWNVKDCLEQMRELISDPSSWACQCEDCENSKESANAK